MISMPGVSDSPMLIQHRCAVKGCLNDGHLAVRLCVPATGYAIDMHEPLRAIIGVVLCIEHYYQQDASDLAVYLAMPGMREQFLKFVRAKGGKTPPPDFGRAFLEGVNLHNPDWKSYMHRRQRAGKR